MIRRRTYIILMLVLIFIVVGCSTAINEYSTLVVDDYNGIDINMVDHYEIDVDLDTKNRTYSASQRVTYVNNVEEELEEIYFHLYPNAYQSLETAPVLFDEDTLSNGYTPGYIEIEHLEVDSSQVDFQIEGEGDTILRIDLQNPLKPGKKVEIDFEYIAKLPVNIDRFGYGKNVFNFGNWYPIACVYDDTGWNLDPYYNIGDPFYSNISNYDVSITTLEDVIVASSGNIIEERTKGDRKTYTIEGKLIRDFAWVASTDFTIEETIVGDTVIKLYAMEDNKDIGEHALEVGRESIEIFNRVFGKYPYGVYSIVMTEFPTGMEYPGIVFINKDYYNEKGKDYLEQVIVHETAHQWWYGVVGNDQIDEAWLDEALATYSEIIYMYNKFGEKEAENYYYYTCELAYEYGKDHLGPNNIVNKSLDEFKGWEDYGLLVYTKGAMFINEIKEDFGIEVVYDILNQYYATYRFYNGTTEGFLEICEQVTDTSFEERADQWLFDKMEGN